MKLIVLFDKESRIKKIKFVSSILRLLNWEWISSKEFVRLDNWSSLTGVSLTNALDFPLWLISLLIIVWLSTI